jgi:hypothetical protein
MHKVAHIAWVGPPGWRGSNLPNFPSPRLRNKTSRVIFGDNPNWRTTDSDHSQIKDSLHSILSGGRAARNADLALAADDETPAATAIWGNAECQSKPLVVTSLVQGTF